MVVKRSHKIQRKRVHNRGSLKSKRKNMKKKYTLKKKKSTFKKKKSTLKKKKKGGGIEIKKIESFLLKKGINASDVKYIDEKYKNNNDHWAIQILRQYLSDEEMEDMELVESAIDHYSKAFKKKIIDIKEFEKISQKAKNRKIMLEKEAERARNERERRRELEETYGKEYLQGLDISDFEKNDYFIKADLEEDTYSNLHFSPNDYLKLGLIYIFKRAPKNIDKRISFYLESINKYKENLPQQLEENHKKQIYRKLLDEYDSRSD